MLDETVTIPAKEYERLLISDSKLDGLEGAGVDNWEGYDDAKQYRSDVPSYTTSDSINRLEIIDHRQCTSCRGRLAENVLQKSGEYKEQPCHICQGAGCAGRRQIFWDDRTKLDQSLQDEGRTLKIWISDRE